MCGIAGIVGLTETEAIPEGCLRSMADALVHRGPDEEGFCRQPGVGLASRRLAIVDLTDGRQPVTNEDGSVVAVFNGEIFDHADLRRDLQRRGHRFVSQCDTEVLPHLWEEWGEDLFSRLEGQFAFALWDGRRRELVIGRDRFGICPLYWTTQGTDEGHWFLFASEIKALLASGLVSARPDLRGIDHVFTFFAQPGPATCLQGVQALLPGHYLRIRQRSSAEAGIEDRVYWSMDYPDRGREVSPSRPDALVDELEDLLSAAVKRRLRADVPVASYLSGGVDSSLVLAMASRYSPEPITAFTIRIKAPGLDETGPASAAARHVGVKPVVVACGRGEILDAYPALIRAAECPVNDTCCAALLLLAREVHRRGFKVVLTGEGADESLAGYGWYKLQKVLGGFDVLPGLPLSPWLLRAYLRGQGADRSAGRTLQAGVRAFGGPNAWLSVYGTVAVSRQRFYGPRLRPLLEARSPYDGLGLDGERLARWHPLHRGLAVGMRIHLPGLLLSTGGDRVAMHSSVETRYPFLDEKVVSFLATVHPRWKLRGFREKYLLRRVAERWLPPNLAWRPKAAFQAPFDLLAAQPAPAFIEQLLSEESLRRTDYFNPAAVRYWRQVYPHLSRYSGLRRAVEMGLGAVVATQLWHQLFIDDRLCETPAAFAGTPA